jgi:hypothetical protein
LHEIALQFGAVRSGAHRLRSSAQNADYVEQATSLA